LQEDSILATHYQLGILLALFLKLFWKTFIKNLKCCKKEKYLFKEKTQKRLFPNYKQYDEETNSTNKQKIKSRKKLSVPFIEQLLQVIQLFI